MLCVGISALTFCSKSLNLKGVRGESFDVIACWLIAVIFRPPDTEDRSAILKFLFCFVAA